MSVPRVSLIFATAFLACPVHAENWPRWRGPNADGSSKTANPPTTWSEQRNIKWKIEIPGRGSSTPIVWEDNVFILTAIKTEREREAGKKRAKISLGSLIGAGVRPAQTHYHQFVVLCYDRKTGEEKWRTVATEAVPHEPGHKTNSFASYSPVTNGKRLFVSFGSHGVYCFDMQGKKVWGKDLGTMETQMGYGEGSSPALHDDTLIVPFDHEKQSFYAALDTSTGEQKWRVDRDEASTWSTPTIVPHKGGHQVIASGVVVRSYDLETGSQIWQCGGQAFSPIPCPIVKDGVTYCMTGFLGNAIYAISLDAKGDVSDTDAVLWKRNDAAPYVASAVLYEDQLYYTKSLGNILTSVKASSGETVFEKQRIPGVRSLYASPVAASNRIYFTGRGGATVVLKHGNSFEVLATNRLDDTFDGSPAIVDDEMFLRGEKYLYCIVQE